MFYCFNVRTTAWCGLRDKLTILETGANCRAQPFGVEVAPINNGDACGCQRASSRLNPCISRETLIARILNPPPQASMQRPKLAALPYGHFCAEPILLLNDYPGRSLSTVFAETVRMPFVGSSSPDPSMACSKMHRLIHHEQALSVASSPQRFDCRIGYDLIEFGQRGYSGQALTAELTCIHQQYAAGGLAHHDLFGSGHS